MQAQDKHTALGLVREQRPDLVALDVSLTPGSTNGKEGMEILGELLNIAPRAKVIMITANDEKENMLEAVARGAYDYFVKPINLEEIRVVFKRALYIQKLEQENEKLVRELQEKHEFEEMVGSCVKMQEVFSIIKRVSPIDVTVLINGESGTGKELVARAIHYSSLRKDNPLVVINCGAIPENLLESELFGHERGAFTDAYNKKIGKFELANNGTVFLDEIGELSLSLQVKMLRFLQERVIERVGGNEQIELDVRIIAATNSDLKKKMQEGSFREDLYYRLSVVSVSLPPLRERNGDIELLANYCLQRFARESNKKIKGFSREAINAIKRYPWPGNVRELENKIKRAVILSNTHLITTQDLGLEISSENTPRLLKEAREQLEKRLIKEALMKSKGNISLAAREIGISRVGFYDLMRKYKITK